MNKESDSIQHGEAFMSDYLAHYGVLGMKWGVRKDGRKGSSRRRQKQGTSKDHKRAERLRKKKISQMSNAELKDLTTRLNLEKNFRQVSPKKSAKAKALIASILGGAATITTIYNFAKSPAGKAIAENVAKAANAMLDAAFPIDFTKIKL